jgi:tight adherence protein C
MNLSILTIGCLWGACAAGLAWYCGLAVRQITYVTLADGRTAERKIPLMFRLLLPWAPNVFPLVRGKALEKPRERIARRLISAGFEGLFSADEILALTVLLPVVMGVAWIGFVLLCAAAAPGAFLLKARPGLCVIGILWLHFYPILWLRSRRARRHHSIRRALPFTLDLLTLSVEAGMDFMTALQRNVTRARIDALNEELIRVLREIQIGKTRRQALRDLSTRVDLADLRSVVNALVQADELGVSIGTILRIQSDQIRQKRFDRAERLANEAPVKMLFPLMFFIFPAVFLILLGPVVVQLIDRGF